MLTIQHRPDLATERLYSWLKRHVAYDPKGRMGAWLIENVPLPPGLACVAEAVCPGVEFFGVVLQAYRDGNAVTDCHSDAHPGFILSLGATRTFRMHRIGSACDCDLDACEIECVNGTVILMDEDFHKGWHHQIAADPGVTGERLSLVFRSKAKG